MGFTRNSHQRSIPLDAEVRVLYTNKPKQNEHDKYLSCAKQQNNIHFTIKTVHARIITGSVDGARHVQIW